MHTIRVAKYNGNTNMSAVCAVNKRTATSLSASTTYQGVLVGQSSQTGTMSVTVAAGTGTTSAATGTYRLSGGTAVALTGTYTASTNGLTLTGGGYTFRGAVAGTTFAGAYSGTNSASGGFSAVNAASGVTTYCGSFGGGATGVFNMQVSGTTLSGLALASDDTDPPTRFSATVSGASFTGRTSGDATISGTIAGQSINGTFTTLDNLSGTFSATACVVG